MIKTIESFPLFMDSKCLVELGLFPSTDSVYFSRLRGNGPNYIRFGKKILYKREDVLKWIESKTISCEERAKEKYKKKAFITVEDCHCEIMCKTPAEHLYRMTGEGVYWINKNKALREEKMRE